MNAEDLDASQHLTAHMLATKQTDAAEALLRQLTRLSLRASWIWRRLGMLELQSARSAEAINSFQRALRDDSTDACAWEGLGEAYMRQGRYTAAIKAYKRAVSLDTTAIPALLGMAEVYIKLGLHVDAIACYQQALAMVQERGRGRGGEEDGQASLPVWIGLADAHAVAARDHHTNGFYGRAAESSQHALEALATAAAISSGGQARIGSIWKIAGDVCLLAERLGTYTQLFSTETLQRLWQVMAGRRSALHTWTLEQLADGEGSSEQAMWHWHDAASFRIAMVKLAALAYAHAMQDWDDTELCNDLSLAFYRLHCLSRQADRPLKSAIDCVQAGLRHRADSALLWNLLGVYTMQMDARLSQHAFIQAIRLDDKDPRPWANYGYLCLHQLDVDLAKEAFTTAQTLDPECVSAWIGRALLVQSDDVTERMRLFEHALDLAGGMNAEAVHGLSLAWLRSAHDSAPSPLFAMRKHLEGQPDDTAAWHLYTLLLERAQLYERALSANDAAMATVAASPSSTQQATWVLQSSRARLLTALRQFPDALRVFAQLDDSNDQQAAANSNVAIIELVVRGITQFFCNELADSLTAFEQALTLAADNETQRAQVVLWLAQVLWALGTQEHQELAKQQLFSILGENTNLDAIVALFVIGLVSDDATLTAAALGELVQLPADVMVLIGCGRHGGHAGYFRLPEKPVRAYPGGLHWLRGMLQPGNTEDIAGKRGTGTPGPRQIDPSASGQCGVVARKRVETRW
ncbi:hypothetical protein SYNPS1DRAFT_29317 [Syncephalis pseudoplumigaleata]|uniref:TPR-like protein n=1 Tax=Syncephalis pseudoplumigaleata TaxID=1712513 RepID=A0A4P9YZT9_9FUNG|nr:hypothetical protein SYNPS1DRAFT_29317 [Syncephalis pseudoplumigaleata]|eukprot:RKP24941.1 hypothetical protein SYNPS1DRAFT_29317 [Syncephalis pseudoplumigaleata]